MTSFLAKITNRKNVDLILSGQTFIHEDIYNFKNEIKVGSVVFFVFGGDRAQIDWEQGLIGFGKVVKAPFDEGYSASNNRYFRIQIQPDQVLPAPIPPKYTKIHPLYAGDLYDVPYVGANHIPTQAIARTDDKGTDVLFKVIQEYAANGGVLNETSIKVTVSEMTTSHITLPKPFLLLAGISGTGKTRFVREQAKKHCDGNLSNYRLIPVRPDWHEPSDLLGYVSRIGANGSARYVVTDLLKFVVQAWRDAADLADSSASVLPCKAADAMTPFWLCLDEMNLAPVEQYFADYLAVVETRNWQDGNYTCDPLLKAATIQQLDADGRLALRKELQLDDERFGRLWDYFVSVGIPLPPNLIVAGTVNMDETTHGFSRKVIDRAFTIDFGVFYPNDFAEFFPEDKINVAKTLGFPLLSSASKEALAGISADAGGAKSIAFMEAINAVLRGSPFELAYRALNELLLAVVCFNPKDDAELYAVWDDFLMSKVLPRIDGDAEKLGVENDASLLTRLRDEIAKQFVNKAETRPDLLREVEGSGVCAVAWRAEQKLNWMQKRLDANGFTTFWP